MQQCFLGINVAMSFNRLQLEYALEGSSNYIAWKERMEAMLEDNRLNEFIEKDIPKPPTTDAQDLSKWRKYVAKREGLS